MLATDERTEVDELLAMLDGEPECGIGSTKTISGVWQGSCQQPARWIAKLVCGHPFVICDEHYQEDATRNAGVIVDGCGALHSWAPPPARLMVTSTGLLPVTATAPVWLPL